MNEYMKPDYEVMVFEANEYVAACPFTPGAIVELDFECAGDDTLFKVGTQQSTGVWTGNSSTNGADFSGAQGMLYENKKYDATKSDSYIYGFGGPINDAYHQNNAITNGKYMSIYNSSVGSDLKVGDKWNSSILCNCDLGTGNSVSHHHVLGWRTVGDSKNFS